MLDSTLRAIKLGDKAWDVTYQEELGRYYAVQNQYDINGSTCGYYDQTQAYREGCRIYGEENFVK